MKVTIELESSSPPSFLSLSKNASNPARPRTRRAIERAIKSFFVLAEAALPISVDLLSSIFFVFSILSIDLLNKKLKSLKTKGINLAYFQNQFKQIYLHFYKTFCYDKCLSLNYKILNVEIVTLASFSLFCIVSAFILLSAIFGSVSTKIGFRNVMRRWGNTLLVVCGSLVGSALISGSLVLSDSLDKTFLDTVERMIGEQDAEITLQEKALPEGLVAYLSNTEYEEIHEMIDINEVDGIMPSLILTISPQKIDAEGNPIINAYGISLTGVDFDTFRIFGSDPPELVDISENEVLIAEPLARKLEASEGDTLRASYGPLNIDMQIKEIYEENGLIDGSRIIVRNEYLTSQLGIADHSYNTITISAKGGIRPDDYEGEEFEKKIQEAITDFKSDKFDLVITEWKQDALNGWGMKQFVNIFFALSFFGILSGILLIVNLYYMLAEERKREMGILRAIAFTRMQLTKTFIYEGFIYSLLSSLVGSLVGLGIGYALVKTLAKMFGAMMALTGDEEAFLLSFGFKMKSLVISFCLGFLITIITAVLSSHKISKLNIVSAIRNIKERKEIKITCGWIAKTLLQIVLFLASAFSLLSFFGIRQTLINAKEQGGENNPFATMSETQFNDTLDLIQGYLLYFGFVATVFTFVILFNRLVKQLFKKDLSRITITIASIVNIVFTAFIINFESVSSAFEQGAGILLFFFSGVVLVISFALIITHNLTTITKVLIWPIKNIRYAQSIVRIAFRYPAENKTRTGLTLVMFALVIFLIAYISMVKATMNEESKKVLENALGGYDLLVQPGEDITSGQIDVISQDLEDLENVSKSSSFLDTRVTLPQYLYKDLPESPYMGHPTQIAEHDQEDAFRTYYSALPNDFIRNTQIQLGERAEGYESDEEVWEAVINDSSKVVLGDSFTQQGFGQQPDLKIGEKILIADLFGNGEKEREIIGIVKSQGEGGAVQASLYPFIITSIDHVKEQFESDYIDKFSNKYLFVQFGENGDNTTLTNEVKKELMEYNISYLLNLEDVTKTALSFLNSLLAMFQGFLAFSLVVGTSGLAIIITRAVHERRQQIGMLRSLGFQRSMILAAFYIESTFITLLGIIIGLSMGTIGALIAFEIAYKDQPEATPIFPVGEILLICLGVYIAAMIFALLPSIKAARLKPVEATNYPE